MRKTPTLLLAALMLAVACSEEEPADDTADTSTQADTTTAEDTSTQADAVDDTAEEADTGVAEDATEAPAPTTTEALEAFLAADGYVDWRAEPEAHDSAGPHFGQVRVFVNDTLADAIDRGDSAWPEGSAVVKELFGDAGSETPLGHAYWVKLDADSAGGANIYWYEDYQGSVYASEAGSSLCTGCHSGGQDYLLSTGF